MLKVYAFAAWVSTIGGGHSESSQGSTGEPRLNFVRMPVTGPDLTYTVPQMDPPKAARASQRPLMHREDFSVAFGPAPTQPVTSRPLA